MEIETIKNILLIALYFLIGYLLGKWVIERKKQIKQRKEEVKKDGNEMGNN